jgi:hypothetical protein
MKNNISIQFGEPKQPFLKRLNGHRSDLTKKPFLPVSQHLGLFDHSLEDFNRMKILLIEQNCLWSDFQRENQERVWINYNSLNSRVTKCDAFENVKDYR